jgi:YVTN family beta-propeller protein
LGPIPKVYITNRGSKNVSVIDPGTKTVISTVSVGADPSGIAITPDGFTAYVTNTGSKSVSVISTFSNTVIATLKVGDHPVDVAITPDGASAS